MNYKSTTKKGEGNMKNVTVSFKDTKNTGETPVDLRNGSIVLWAKAGVTLGIYLVTSFRSNNSTPNKENAPYCSLVNLDTGYLSFEERCSRKTTVKRVLSHLRTGDFGGETAIKMGEYIEVYPQGSYDMEIRLDRTSIMNK